jgi:hypothetical protein
MANVNAPFGLKQQTSATGASPNFEMIYKQIAYDDSTKIYTGDPVKMLDSGYISQWTAATAVSQLAGIFAGCEFLSTLTGKMTSSPIWPGAGQVASTAQNTIIAKIIPCTGAIAPTFLVQSDATGVAFADIGMNVDVALGTGNDLNGQSGCYLNVTSTLAATATLPFRITGLYGGLPGAGGALGIQPGSTGPYSGSATGAYNWALVRANVTGAGATGI